jgi:multidrug resistance efflux pump
MEGEIKRAKLLREKGDFAEAERSLAQLMLIAPDDGIVIRSSLHRGQPQVDTARCRRRAD